MLYQEEQMQDLFERKGYLDYLISEYKENVFKDDIEDDMHTLEISKVLNEIIRISVEVYKDFPDVMENYIKSMNK